MGTKAVPAGATASNGTTTDTYKIPIEERHETSQWPTLVAIAAFMVGVCLVPHLGQHLSLLLFYPLPFTRPLFDVVMARTKRFFGLLLVVLNQTWAPTQMVLTFTDEEGNPLDPEQFVSRDKTKNKMDPEGQVVRLIMPDRSIWMSNHQVSHV